MSSQKCSPQNSSSETAWCTAESQNPNPGRAGEQPDVRWIWWVFSLPPCSTPCCSSSRSRRWALRRQDATTILMNGSECRIFNTTQAGQPLVLHQSRSSATKHCSHEKAPRAAPRKASSRSTADRGEAGDSGFLIWSRRESVWAANTAAWERI